MDTASVGGAAAAGAGIGLGMLLLACVVSGLIVGALARLALPGPDPMSWLATIGFGIAGSFIGGLIGSVLHVSSILSLALSIACAAGLIWYFRRRKTIVSSAPRPPPPPPSSPPPPQS
jgi:uncharacterized membrane protein YeaQ/YmgE (transglycosylase-associated protein family)